MRTIHVELRSRVIDLEMTSTVLTISTIRNNFLLPTDTIVSLRYEKEGRKIWCHLNESGTSFLLPEDQDVCRFEVECDKVPYQPATPEDLNSCFAPSTPPPFTKSIVKYLFYCNDGAGKSTVIAVHRRYLVTFRHGTHGALKIGDKMTIFRGEQEEQDEDSELEVTVVDINEALDFVLLKCENDVVEVPPALVSAEESETIVLAGYGNVSSGTGTQNLGFVSGVIHSIRGYYFSLDNRPSAPLMGPFILGTCQSSLGDSGGGCWSSRGLIGLNYGVTSLPAYDLTTQGIQKTATFAPRNIIVPAVRIKESLMTQLRIEQQNEPETSPSKKRKLMTTDVDGLGPQTQFIDKGSCLTDTRTIDNTQEPPE